MCGVVGVWLGADADPAVVAARGVALAREAAIRGLHAYGVASRAPGGLEATRTFSLPDALDAFKDRLDGPPGPRGVVWHNRYSTSGDWAVLGNNQPLMEGGYALCFNGVIDMRTKAEMEAAHGLELPADNDGYLFLHWLRGGEAHALAKLEGAGAAFAGVWLDADGNLRALRNGRRPLWCARVGGAQFLASTRDIFERAWAEWSDYARPLAPGRLWTPERGEYAGASYQ